MAMGRRMCTIPSESMGHVYVEHDEEEDVGPCLAKKAGFESLGETELDLFDQKKIPISTRKSTKKWLNVLHMYVKGKILILPRLRQTSWATFSGGCMWTFDSRMVHMKAGLLSFRVGIHRHLTQDLLWDVNVYKDTAFRQANNTLDAHLENLKRSGFCQPAQHKPALSDSDFAKPIAYFDEKDRNRPSPSDREELVLRFVSLLLPPRTGNPGLNEHVWPWNKERRKPERVGVAPPPVSPPKTTKEERRVPTTSRSVGYSIPSRWRPSSCLCKSYRQTTAAFSRGRGRTSSQEINTGTQVSIWERTPSRRLRPGYRERPACHSTTRTILFVLTTSPSFRQEKPRQCYYGDIRAQVSGRVLTSLLKFHVSLTVVCWSCGLLFPVISNLKNCL